jgi:hypothetical protein
MLSFVGLCVIVLNVIAPCSNLFFIPVFERQFRVKAVFLSVILPNVIQMSVCSAVCHLNVCHCTNVIAPCSYLFFIPV